MRSELPLRWTVHCATADDDLELIQLFNEVFGHVMPIERWRWKYAAASVRGVVLKREGRAVAFFGGMPRHCTGPAGSLTAVQNGDVMVLPSERGVFTRHGALYHVVTAYLDQFVGPSALYGFAFGFPNERHFRLGIKLGLYADSGRLMELSWSAATNRSAAGTVTSELKIPQLAATLRVLWPQMIKSWPRYYIPNRDAGRWMARFVSHPVHQYDFLVIRRGLFRKPVCAMVLREHIGHIEWLDYVGPLDSVNLAINAVREFAKQHGNKPVMALFTRSIASTFSESATCVESDICIPVNSCESEEPRPYLNNLWLMGGDTDFL